MPDALSFSLHRPAGLALLPFVLILLLPGCGTLQQFPDRMTDTSRAEEADFLPRNSAHRGVRYLLETDMDGAQAALKHHRRTCGPGVGSLSRSQQSPQRATWRMYSQTEEGMQVVAAVEFRQNERGELQADAYGLTDAWLPYADRLIVAIADPEDCS